MTKSAGLVTGPKCCAHNKEMQVSTRQQFAVDCSVHGAFCRVSSLGILLRLVDSAAVSSEESSRVTEWLWERAGRHLPR